MAQNGYDDCGVIYVAAGESFVEEARISAQSVNRLCSDVSVTLFTDIDHSPKEFDQVQKIPDPNYGFADKIENMLQSPYDRTVYLDCDTYLVDAEGLYDLFDLLQEFDIAAAHDSKRTSPAEGALADAYDDGVPESFPMFNGGLLAFRSSDRVDSVLETWLQKYREHLSVDENATDQEALRSTLYDSDVRVATLPPEYNFRIPYPQLVYGKVKLLHGRAANFAEIEDAVNRDLDTMRWYVPAYAGPKGLIEDYETVRPLVNPGQSRVAVFEFLLSARAYGMTDTMFHLLLGGGSAGRYRYNAIRQSIEEHGLLGTGVEIIRWALTGEFDVDPEKVT